ncbi:hypothetical protein CRG98_006458 [Punica granatum]|uniref:Uncharacterized protein n=1 Tax=Punica granatum TaxID=22663 RepID=A0A2I0KXG6_PUNGR|nr:hypothetical protein CRG98_006458 [Punica granatum]
MLGRGPKAVNAGPRPDAGPKLKSGAEAQKWGRSPMRGRNAKAGPKLDAVNAGPEPDARPKAHAVNVCSIRKCNRCKSKVMFSVSKKLVSVSLTWEGESALDPQLALPWRKGEGRRWSTCEGWHDSPIMRGEDRGWSTREGWHNSPVVRGGWPRWTAFGHSTSHRGEVKTAGGLPLEGWHNSPVVRGEWPGWTAFGHSTSRRGEVKTAGGLPAKVGTTRLSCGTW